MDHSPLTLGFVVYRSRSGSTLFADRLGRHPDVLVTPESNVIPNILKYYNSNDHSSCKWEDFVRGLAHFIFSEQKLQDWKLMSEEFSQQLIEYGPCDWTKVVNLLCAAYRDMMKPDSRVVMIKKSGWYSRNLYFLLRSIPNAMAIGVIRDPRAVYNSARVALHSENRTPLAGSLISNARGWRNFVRQVEETSDMLPQRVLFVRYEDLLEDLVLTLQRSWNHLGLNLTPIQDIQAILVDQADSHLITDRTRHLHENVTREPIKELGTKWQNELPCLHASIMKWICRKEMKRYLYY